MPVRDRPRGARRAARAPLAGAVPRLRRRPGRGREHRPGAPGASGATAATSPSRSSTRAPATALMADLTQLARFARLFAALFPGMDVKPLLAELKARVRRGARLRAGGRSRSATFAAAYAGDPQIVVPRVVASAPKVIVSRVARRHAAVADHRRRHAPSERDRAGQLLAAAALLRPRSGPGCCTPTRTRATSGSSPTGGWASSTSARSARLPDGHPEPIGRLIRLGAGRQRRRGARPTCAPRASCGRTSRSTPERGARLPAARCWTRCASGPFHFTRAWMQEQAARIADPRSEASPARPAAQPAAGLPAHPPGDDRLDRRALPARCHGALPRDRTAVAAGFRTGVTWPTPG